MSISSRKPGYWINSFISLALMFGFGFIPPLFGLTALGMGLIGVLFGAVYGWITIEIAWPSMAGLMAIAVWGYDSIGNVLKSAFGNSTVVMMLFILTFTMYMTRCGCMDAITKWFISRKFIVGRPYMVILAFWLLSVILSFATSNIAAMLFLFSVAIPFCEKLGYKKGDKYPIVLLFSIYMGTQYGICIIPIKPVILMSLALIESATGTAVNRLTYIIFSSILYIFASIVWFLAVRFIIRPDVEAFKSMSEEDYAEYRKEKIPQEAKIGFAATILMVFLMFAPTFLPKNWAFTVFCNKISMIGSILLVLVLLSIVPKNGAAKFNFHEVANSEKMNWNLIFMTAFGLTVATALTSDASGFNEAFTNNLIPLLSSLSPVLLMIVLGTVLHILTSFLNNGAMSAIVVNPMAVIAAALGMNPFFTIAIGLFAIYDGLLTPAGTASAPLLMGHEWMDMKEYYKHAAAIFVGFELFIIGASIVLF